MVRTAPRPRPVASGINAKLTPARRAPVVAYWLSSGLVALLVVASAAGLFVPGLYHDTPDWVAQAQATDLVTLVVVVPTLITVMILAARGSISARIVWLGILGYAVYMFAIYSFDVAFNGLFLVYVAALSLAAWCLATLLTQLNPDDARPRDEARTLVRAVAVYLLMVSALFVLTWMKDIVPALVTHTAPLSLAHIRQLTNPVEVLDLSFLLPLATLASVWLWRRASWGYPLAGMALTIMTVVGVSVVVDAGFEHHINPTLSLAIVPLFAVVTLVGLGLLAGYVRTFQPEAPRGQR